MLLGEAFKDPLFPDILLLCLSSDEVKLLLDVSTEVKGTGTWVVTTDRLALCTDQEFLKVPGEIVLLDGCPVELRGCSQHQLRARACSLEESVQRLLRCTVQISLARHSIVRNKSAARSDMFQAIENVVICPWLLQVKMVGGDGEDIEVLRVKLSLDCIPVDILSN